MAEEKRPANDVAQIRELIFGDKIREYDRKFAELETTITQINDTLKAHSGRLDDQEHKLQQTARDLNAELEKKFSELSKNLSDLQAEITKKLTQLINDKADRLEVGNYLIEMGLRLKGENVMDTLLERSADNGQR